MSAKLGGRRPKSHVIGARIVFYLPLYSVKSQPIIPEGAKRTYHDGTRLQRITGSTISHGIFIYEKEFERCKAYLSQLGYKKIRAEQMKTDLPRYCPKCLKPDGYPHMRLYHKVKSNRNRNADTFNYDLNLVSKNSIKYEVYYSHSKPTLHQCHIGYWTPSGYVLAEGIDPQKMSPYYIVKQNGGFMELEMPDRKLKPGKVLT